MNNFTERRKSDRVKMLAGVEALLQRLKVDYQITTDELLGMCPRRVALELTLPRGLQLTIDFDGDSPQPDVFVLSWHMSTASSTCLAFGVFDSINNYHFQKATDVARGFDRLLQVLESRILAAQDGGAFSQENEDNYRQRYDARQLPWQQAGKVAVQ